MVANLVAIFLRTAVLFLFWIFLSGKFDAVHLFLGFLSSLAIAILTSFESKPHRNSLKTLRRGPGIFIRGFLYSFWLLGRIILATVHVSRLVLSPKMPLAPRLIKHKSILKSDAAKVIFANSITLTPGTITVDISGNEFLVHELDHESSEDIRTKRMEREIKKIFHPQRMFRVVGTS